MAKQTLYTLRRRLKGKNILRIQSTLLNFWTNFRNAWCSLMCRSLAPLAWRLRQSFCHLFLVSQRVQPRAQPGACCMDAAFLPQLSSTLHCIPPLPRTAVHDRSRAFRFSSHAVVPSTLADSLLAEGVHLRSSKRTAWRDMVTACVAISTGG